LSNAVYFSVGTGVSFSWGLNGAGMKLTTHLDLLQWSRMSEGYTFTVPFLCNFVGWTGTSPTCFTLLDV